MRIAMPIMICGFSALAGCAGVAGRGEFHLTADQVNGARGAVMARAWRDAEEQGVDPLWNPEPRFSGATCRWIEPGRKAHCRYRVSRGIERPGAERSWADAEGTLYLTERGWDFGG